jgi:hypothetical protein
MTRTHGRDAGWKTAARSASSPATPALEGETGRQSAGTTSRAGPTLAMRPGGDTGLDGLMTAAALDPASAASAPAAATARNAATAVGHGNVLLVVAVTALIPTSRSSAHAAMAPVPSGWAPEVRAPTRRARAWLRAAQARRPQERRGATQEQPPASAPAVSEWREERAAPAARPRSAGRPDARRPATTARRPVPAARQCVAAHRVRARRVSRRMPR